jgi:hypothetical protein
MLFANSSNLKGLSIFNFFYLIIEEINWISIGYSMWMLEMRLLHCWSQEFKWYIVIKIPLCDFLK